VDTSSICSQDTFSCSVRTDEFEVEHRNIGEDDCGESFDSSSMWKMGFLRPTCFSLSPGVPKNSFSKLTKYFFTGEHVRFHQMYHL
jgi:hypothetical protein